MQTFYGADIRLLYESNKLPTFRCKNDSDLYTTSGSSEGNGALTYSIGLISIDEVWFAGSTWDTANQSYYLYTGQDYWTISPSSFPDAVVYQVYTTGRLNTSVVHGSWGIRPVINLRADVTITGSGTTTDPYKVEGA